MPYCTDCGREVTEEMLFCPQCGRKLGIPRAGFKDVETREYAAEAELKEPKNTSSRKIRKGRLYQQWVAYAGLPPEATRATKASRDIPVRGKRKERSFALMLILLGVCIGILCTVTVFLLIKPF